MFQGLHRPPTNSLYWRADSKYVKNITVDPRVQEISSSKDSVIQFSGQI